MASLGQLTAGIAHEIKNPLNFINNFAEVNAELADELLEAASNGEDTSAIIADLKRNAEVIAEHGRRADSIVRSMMEHARHGAADKEPVEVNAFVEEYVNLAYHGHRAADPGFDVAIERSYAEDAGSAMMVRQDMARVLINLLGNAFDAVSAEGAPPRPTVSVATRRGTGADGPDPTVVIEIRDNGPGVPPDLSQKIFEPFFTTKPTGQGTGLGLSLSYEIVTTGHGGSMELVEAEGPGALFRLTLPAL
jgi:signal transduction histidine kinase